MKQVLVDSSVWIDFFKGKEIGQLEQLIDEDLVVINELILSELTPFLKHQNEFHAAESLMALPVLPLNIDWRGIQMLQELNLKNGINGVGLPDLIIVQQVISENLALLTHDKRFQLMQEHLKFDLFPS